MFIEKKFLRQITYSHDDISNLFVKISAKFLKVILINKHESYLLELPDDKFPEDGSKVNTEMRKLPQLQDQIVRYISPDNEGNFFLVVCHNYD